MGGKDPCDSRDPSNKKILDFIREHWDKAQKIAKELGIPPEYLLGLSAHESGWGTSPLSSKPNEDGTITHNYFSLRHPASGEIGWAWSKGDKQGRGKKKMAVFKDWNASADSFAKDYGDDVRGATTYAEFTSALAKLGGFNPVDPAKGGDPDFEKKVRDAIDSVKRRLHCDKHAHRCGAECDDFERYGYCDRRTTSEYCWQHS